MPLARPVTALSAKFAGKLNVIPSKTLAIPLRHRLLYVKSFEMSIADFNLKLLFITRRF